MKPDFVLHFSSLNWILFQLRLLAPSSLLSLYQRLDLYFVKIAVKQEAQQMLCFPKDPPSCVCQPVGR